MTTVTHFTRTRTTVSKLLSREVSIILTKKEAEVQVLAPSVDSAMNTGLLSLINDYGPLNITSVSELASRGFDSTRITARIWSSISARHFDCESEK